MDTIGKRIAYLRKKKNLTQQELADLINVSDKTISKWENDLGLPGIDILPNLSEKIDTTLDFLVSGNSYIQKVENPNNELLNIKYGYKICLYATFCLIFALFSLLSLHLIDGYYPGNASDEINRTIAVIISAISFSCLVFLAVMFNNFYITARKIYKIKYFNIRLKTIILMTIYFLSLSFSAYTLFSEMLIMGIVWLLIQILIALGYILMLIRFIKEKNQEN